MDQGQLPIAAEPAVVEQAPPAASAVPPGANAPGSPKYRTSSTREVVETIVFVVVLVLLLKNFAAEAFVIPTGSMAETLWGYQKVVACPECGYEFPVNCSSEVEDPPKKRSYTTSCTCPNCRLYIEFERAGLHPTCNPGDRVLVGKSLYDSHLLALKPFDVVVFKFPEEPQVNFVPMNYIKRLIGMPGQTIGLHYGDIYFANEDLTPAVKEELSTEEQNADVYRGNLYGVEGNQLITRHDHGSQETLHILARDANVLIDGREGTIQELKNIRLGMEVKVVTPRNGQNLASRVELRQPLRRQMKRDEAKELLEQGGKRFQILRKSPDKVLALQRLVYDNDHQPVDLAGKGQHRWAPEKDLRPQEGNEDGDNGDSPTGYRTRRARAEVAKEWKTDEARGFQHPERAPANGLAWLRYRHILRNSQEPQLITDFIGYNSARSEGPLNWVGDLILECEVTLEKAEPNAELRLELVKGADRLQARFQLDTGLCTLLRVPSQGEAKVLAEKSTAVKKPGTYQLRFANVDQKLTVWVNKGLPFENGQIDEPAGDPGTGQVRHGPTIHDLAPAGIGVQGAALSVHKLKLWRDTYYTYYRPAGMGAPPGNSPHAGNFANEEIWSRPSRWKEAGLHELPATTLYVQPGHYLCLGDNSPQSSDSRSWGQRNRDGDEIGGLVPESLMLGRALMVYYPFGWRRAGPIK